MEVYDELEKALKELEKKDKVINELLRRISDLEFEVERLEKVVKVKDEGFKASTEDLCEESTKIEKAIEYIKEHTNLYTSYLGKEPKVVPKLELQREAYDKLLDILKGVDKE